MRSAGEAGDSETDSKGKVFDAASLASAGDYREFRDAVKSCTSGAGATSMLT